MLQRYRLRLGDGTVLLVDLDGLHPWAEDREATVQTEDSRQWRPLREVLARERARARRQALLRPAVHESLPPRRPVSPREESQPSPAATREDGLPLVPPPPKRATTTPAPPTREDGLPLVPPPPRNAPVRRGTAAETPPPDASVEVDLRSIDPKPVIVEPGGPGIVASDEIVPAALPPDPGQDQEAAPPVGLDEEAAPPVGLDQEAAPRVPLFEPASLLESEPAPVLDPGPAVAPPPTHNEVEAPPPDGVDAIVATAAEAEVFEEEAPGREPDDDLPATVIVGAPRAVAVDEVEGETLHDAAAFGEEAPGSPGGVSALADEPRPASDSRAIDDLPVIPFKADSPSPTRRTAANPSPGSNGRSAKPRPAPSIPDSPRPSPRRPATEVEELPSWVADSRVQVVLRGAAAVGGALSRSLAPINRLERGEPAIEIEEGAFTRFRARAGAQLESARERLSEATRGLVSGLKDRLASGGSDEESFEEPAAPVARFEEPAAPVARFEEPAAPVARFEEPAAAVARFEPPVAVRSRSGETFASVSGLPVVPLADAVGSGDWQDEDVYEGPGLGERLRLAWQWTARVVLIMAVVGGAALAVVSWRAWFPEAAQVGEATFHEIDRHARAAELAAEQNRVLAESAERLPYLTSETVRLILSHSPTGVLEIPDIFEVATDAADWGAWALTEAEKEELRTLRGELVATLGPTDQGRVRDYEHARESGLVFPLDNRLGVLVWARGARELAPEAQERIRELLAKAVAAGLTPGHAPASAIYRP